MYYEISLGTVWSENYWWPDKKSNKLVSTHIMVHNNINRPHPSDTMVPMSTTDPTLQISWFTWVQQTLPFRYHGSHEYNRPHPSDIMVHRSTTDPTHSSKIREQNVSLENNVTSIIYTSVACWHRWLTQFLHLLPFI